jgi:hypothetical protein
MDGFLFLVYQRHRAEWTSIPKRFFRSPMELPFLVGERTCFEWTVRFR